MADKPRTIADKLDFLFDTVRPSPERAYSLREISARAAAAGHRISHVYIGDLRAGRQSGLTLEKAQALAAAFGVPPEYWFDGEAADRLHAQLVLLRALSSTRVRAVAARLTRPDTSAAELLAIAQAIDALRDQDQDRG